VKKIILSFVLGLVGLTALFVSPASAATVYSDISSSHRAFDEIYYLAQGDITTSDKSFVYSPDAPMTRAHAAAMIGRAIQLSGKSTSGKFSDVPSSHFASGYINESVSRGIINGYGDGTFRPNVTLTRGEMALLISRAFGYQSATTNDAANELMSKGVALGVGKGNFGTVQLMKRGDFAVFLARAVNADFRVYGNKEIATQMFVNEDNLNFRKGPGAGFAATKQFFTGYPVEVYYSVGEWVYAKGENSVGFFHKDYLSTDQPIVGSTPDPINLPEEAVKKPINELMVIVDPGHGDHDPGANGFGYIEKNVVLDVSLRMKKYFQQTPIQVKLTREKDVFVSLPNRAAFAYKNNADLFVSVHANALNGSANGQETFYYASNNTNDDQSKALATYIHKRMQEAWGLYDRGIKYGNYHVLRENSVPAALAEIGFLDNRTDNAYIASANRREQIARAIFLGTLDYYYHYDNRPEVTLLYSKFNAKPSIKHY
jgi:N-acetylmuramoyl-L-alanine amidase